MLISTNGQRILKILHLFAVCFWVGGGMGLLLLLYVARDAQSSAELFGILKSYRFVNVIVTVYMGAYGTLFTGLAYSLCTNRGFLRHKWIILKWAMTLGMIVFGSAYLGGWSTQMLETAAAEGLSALASSEFLAMYDRQLLALALYMLLFILAFFLSVYQPWEREELKRRLNET